MVETVDRVGRICVVQNEVEAGAPTAVCTEDRGDRGRVSIERAGWGGAGPDVAIGAKAWRPECN